jgi:hypothetical protein
MGMLGVAGFWTFLTRILDSWDKKREHKWKKDDKDTDQTAAIAKLNVTADEHTNQLVALTSLLKLLQNGLMLLLYDRFEHLAKSAVDKGEITVQQKKVVFALYDAYHANGGNGWATELKGMVDELPVHK